MYNLFGFLALIAIVVGPFALLTWLVTKIPAIRANQETLHARSKLVTLGSLGLFVLSFIGFSVTMPPGGVPSAQSDQTGAAPAQVTWEQRMAKVNAKVANGAFLAAVRELEEVPAGDPNYTKAQALITEYKAKAASNDKKDKSERLYQSALRKASTGGFTAALKDLYLISKSDPNYSQAQVKIREYKAKEAAVRKAEAAKARAAAQAKAKADAARAVYANLGPNEYITNDGYLAALTEELLDKVTEYSINGDSEAVANLAATGTVIMLKPGLRVFRVDSSGFLGSKVKIRPKGQNIEVWTVMEAISRGD